MFLTCLTATLLQLYVYFGRHDNGLLLLMAKQQQRRPLPRPPFSAKLSVRKREARTVWCTKMPRYREAVGVSTFEPFYGRGFQVFQPQCLLQRRLLSHCN